VVCVVSSIRKKEEGRRKKEEGKSQLPGSNGGNSGRRAIVFMIIARL